MPNHAECYGWEGPKIDSNSMSMSSSSTHMPATVSTAIRIGNNYDNDGDNERCWRWTLENSKQGLHVVDLHSTNLTGVKEARWSTEQLLKL